MTLRTTSLKRQHQAWALLTLVVIAAYIALVIALDLGNPLRFFGSHQMRVLLPLVILLRLLTREFRWDGVVRQAVKDVDKVGENEARKVMPEADSGVAATDSETRLVESQVPLQSQSLPPTPNNYTSLPQTPIINLQTAFQSSSETAESLWERAREIIHNAIPNPEEDAEYLDLIISSAERGYVPALAKLGDYAFRRGAFVEAYFWTKLAHRRLELSGNANPNGLKEISDMLRDIRREWAAEGQPLELENIYENFPAERGELGRAFLRLDAGSEVWQTREFIRILAENGNPDAALFVNEVVAKPFIE